MRADEKQAFSERLKLALRRSPRPVETPTELALQFSLRHPNDPVTAQAAQKWLTGKAKPTADKMATLADWLGVSEHWLSHGSPEPHPQRTGATTAPPLTQDLTALSDEEKALLVRYRQLSGRRRQLINELVIELSLEQEIWPGNS